MRLKELCWTKLPGMEQSSVAHCKIWIKALAVLFKLYQEEHYGYIGTSDCKIKDHLGKFGISVDNVCRFCENNIKRNYTYNSCHYSTYNGCYNSKRTVLPSASKIFGDHLFFVKRMTSFLKILFSFNGFSKQQVQTEVRKW